MIVGTPQSFYTPFYWPEGATQGGNTIEEFVGCPVGVRLAGFEVYIDVVNTVGASTLVLTNVGTTNTMLSAASFDLTGLAADTMTTMTLATEADLRLAANGLMKIGVTSSDAGYDGSGLILYPHFLAV